MTDYRAQFPVLVNEPDLVYLDTAATAQKPQAVVDAITRAYACDYATVHRGVYRRSQTMTEAYEEARATVARFINAASPAEVVFVRGATEGINLVAQSWAAANLGEGDEVVVTELEHHSNIVPWQLASEIAGFGLKVIPITPDGDIDYEAAARVIGPRTKLVAVTHISNVLGTLVDVKRIVALAKAVDARVLVDGCQAAPRQIVDVQDLGADFYVFSGHKLYGPTGIGVLWGRLDVLNAMRPYHGGGAMIETVTFERTTYLPAPQRFEAGTPHIVGALGLKAAIDYVTAIGLPAIRAHEAELTRQAIEALSRFNSVRVLGPGHHTGIVSFVMEGVHPHDIGTILDEAGINIRAGHHCAQPLMERLGVGSTARASFGIYNTPADVERLAEGMDKVVRIFR
ncbi:aminotransferase class V-fold PLP-dependent enzyme [Pedomonas sp. V897]|uniref:aminotransferase class V-fold PLP-dependent enzyme n=1 Tax=Pedomonas sp. V897 TaxID=3446482 RepID=UPI003EDFE60B